MVGDGIGMGELSVDDKWEGSILVDEWGYGGNAQVRYEIMQAIGGSCVGGVTVYRAWCSSSIYGSRWGAVVVVSEKNVSVINNLEMEIENPMGGCGIQHVWASFRHELEGYQYHCFALPYAEHGSLLSFMARRFPCGLPQRCILFFLYRTLKSLSHLHARGRIHGWISAAHIFVYERQNAGGYYSNLAYGGSTHDLFADQQRDPRCTSVSSWAAAPEPANSAAADIWAIGITALELAYGGLTPITSRAALDSLVNNIRRRNRLPKTLDARGLKKSGPIFRCLPKKRIAPTGFEYRTQERLFSKAFVSIVAHCLRSNPSKRPTADQLLRRKIFIHNFSFVESISI